MASSCQVLVWHRCKRTCVPVQQTPQSGLSIARDALHTTIPDPRPPEAALLYNVRLLDFWHASSDTRLRKQARYSIILVYMLQVQDAV